MSEFWGDGYPHPHIIPTLQQLHSLQVQYRIMFKVLILVNKPLNDLAPPYLSSLLHPHSPAHLLCSSDAHCLSLPPSKLCTMSDTALSVASPTPWIAHLGLHQYKCATSFKL